MQSKKEAIGDGEEDKKYNRIQINRRDWDGEGMDTNYFTVSSSTPTSATEPSAFVAAARLYKD